MNRQLASIGPAHRSLLRPPTPRRADEIPRPSPLLSSPWCFPFRFAGRKSFASSDVALDSLRRRRRACLSPLARWRPRGERQGPRSGRRRRAAPSHYSVLCRSSLTEQLRNLTRHLSSLLSAAST